MPELAYINGSIMPIEEAVVPIEDRGYQFGDAVYEVITSLNGRPFMLDAHLARLERSMTELSFLHFDMRQIRAAVLKLFAEGALDRCGLYIQISRGVAPRKHAFPASTALQFIMTLRNIVPYPDEMRAGGVKAITVPDLRWGKCDIKTVQLLYNVLAKQQALDSGTYDAVFVSADGVVRESTSSNLFIAVDGTLITHPLTRNILPGITRQCLLEISRECAIPCEERSFKTDALYAADEVFLSGTITEVMPIVEVDGRTITNGAVGPIARRLLRKLHDKM